ncbi:MAG: thermonuclease family protein [Candidatus Omnitrophica bacterium]|nr:thermonuclease family protein [Candidatus Omnitrophota bacterium]
MPKKYECNYKQLIRKGVVFFIFIHVLFGVITVLLCWSGAGEVYGNSDYGRPMSFDLKKSPRSEVNYSNIKCVKVIDGDTIILEDGEKVRLIGIDCPEASVNDKLLYDSQITNRNSNEIIKMGKKATKFTKNLLENENVKLEFDLEERDKYGRLLAYVFINVTNIKGENYLEYISLDEELYLFINASIVKSGYAGLMTIPPNIKYSEMFEKLYQEARENNRGLWE